MDHDGSEWRRHPVYDPTFPTLEAPSKEEAIEQYWDLYYERVDAPMESHPNALTLHDLSDVNSIEGRRDILAFLGYEPDEMVTSGSYRENTALQNFFPDTWHYFRRMVRRAIPGSPPHSEQ